MSEEATEHPPRETLSEPDDLHHADGTIVGEAVVAVRCADCGRRGWVRVTDLAQIRCVRCVRKAEDARPRPPDLAVIEGEGERGEQPTLPFLSAVEEA